VAAGATAAAHGADTTGDAVSGYCGAGAEGDAVGGVEYWAAESGDRWDGSREAGGGSAASWGDGVRSVAGDDYERGYGAIWRRILSGPEAGFDYGAAGFAADGDTADCGGFEGGGGVGEGDDGDAGRGEITERGIRHVAGGGA